MKTYSLVGVLALVLVSVVLGLLSAPETMAQVLDFEWQCLGGNYSDDTQWDLPAVPCNDGGVTFNVTIPADCGTVIVDLSCTVDRLEIGDNSTFFVRPGVTFEVIVQADIAGIVRATEGDFLAPNASFVGTRARVTPVLSPTAGTTANVVIGAETYSSAGLGGNTTLLSADDMGSAIDLSELGSLHADYDDGTGSATFQAILVTDGAALDLSALSSLTPPARREDYLYFGVSSGSSLDLPVLATIPGTGGYTFVDTRGGGVVSFPALETVEDLQLYTDAGGRILVNGAQPVSYSSVDLPVNADIFNASGAASLLDLSAIRTIDANNHTIRASAEATIDLLTLGRIDGRLHVVVSNSASVHLGALVINALGSMTVSTGGTVGATSIEPLSVFNGNYSIDLSGGTARLAVADLLDLDSLVSLSAGSESTVAVGGRLTYRHDFIADFELGGAIVELDGGATQQVEVGGADVSILRPADSNFGFGQMVVGGTRTTTVELEDLHSNRDRRGKETLYLLGLDPGTGNPDGPSGLRILNESTLVLNCVNVYVFDDDEDPFGELINDLIPKGQNTVPFDGGFLGVGEDADADGWATLCDNCPQTPNPEQEDIDEDSFGDVCDNCAFVRNVSQSDVNDDFEGDHCDLDDGLIYVQFAEPNVVQWQEEEGFMTWNVYRGDLETLRNGGPYTQPPDSNACSRQECGLMSESLDDADVPPQGTTCFYLVTGVSGGIESGLGRDSAGNERANVNPCP